MKRSVLFRMIVVLSMILPVMTFAQTRLDMNHTPPDRLEPGQPLTLTIAPTGALADVLEMFVHVRWPGDDMYQEYPLEPDGGLFSYSLETTDAQPGELSYFFSGRLSDEQIVTLPETDPMSHPFVVDILPPAEPEDPPVEVTIISPEPDQTITEELFICVSLLAETEVDTSALSLWIDDINVTPSADVSPYLITYTTSDITSGAHVLKLQLTQAGQTVTLAEWSVEVATGDLAAEPSQPTFFQKLQSNSRGEIYAGYQNQDIRDESLDATYVGWKATGRVDWFRYGGRIFLTSEEDDRQQTKNRFSFELGVNNWLDLRLGDFYPRHNDLLLWGKRVRGAQLALETGYVNVDVVYGTLSRAIDNLYTDAFTQVDTFTVGSTTVLDTATVISLQKEGRGAFQRNIWGARVSFGSPRHVQVGLNVLKIKDDDDSIISRQNEPDIEFNDAIARPKDNLAGAVDLQMAFHRQRIKIKSSFAASLVNNDISTGPLNAQRAADLGYDLDTDTSDLIDKYSDWIVINENLNVLPIRFQSDGTTESFMPKGVFAFNSSLSLNYLRNYLTVKYRWLGPQFFTLVNSTIRRDMQGVAISDRIRLMQNQLYATVGLEFYEDNLLDTKDATTQTQTYRIELAYYPLGQLPDMIVSFSNNARDNDLPLANPLLSDDLLPRAVRYKYTDTSGRVIMTTPRNETANQLSVMLRHSFNLARIDHRATVSVSNTDRQDDVFVYGNSQNQMAAFNLVSAFDQLPLTTDLKLNLNQTESMDGNAEANFNGFGLGLAYRWLDDRLRTYARFTYSQNSGDQAILEVDKRNEDELLDDLYYVAGTSEIDNSTQRISLGGNFDITSSQTVRLDWTTVQISDNTDTDSTSDQVFRARYIFRF